MALLSPGIQLFESSVTPATTVAAASNGVATLGYSTRGPVNKLTRVSSISEFKEVFGDPIEEFPYAHILTQSVLANNTDMYFLRMADPNTEAEADCKVAANFKVEGAAVAIRDNISTTQPGYFMAQWSTNTAKTGPTADALLKIRTVVPDAQVAEGKEIAAYVPMAYEAGTFGPAGTATKILWTSIVDAINVLNHSEFGDYFTFAPADLSADANTDAQIGIIVKAKNETIYNSNSGLSLTITTDVGNWTDGENPEWISWVNGNDDDVATLIPSATATGTFDGVALRAKSTVSTFEGLSHYNSFTLKAKYSGSSMNGVRVVKTTIPSVTGNDTWTISVYDKNGTLEERAGITPDTFIEEMTKFAYIEIEDEHLVTNKWVWYDGTWDLGKGTLLANGEYWNPTEGGLIEAPTEGKDGYPTITRGDKEQYSETQSVNLYLKALSGDEFVNVDEYSFSILATPGMQNTMVQNAAIEVCATRGDAIFLADVPLDLCKSKQSIEDVVAWANGNSGFQSSYCAIYYGWFAQTNPYATDNSVLCPASCFIAPKMVALDQSMGEFYAPAGITRGNLICSDWSYSPDQKDRDKLVGNDNVVNPISYSNTRGVTIMAQKTTDRTTSPLNRVGIRRMTNMIKRNLRSRLVALLFEPNNETSRAKARTIVDDVLSSLRSKECIESYNINVVSGTGANRNDLNVYLSFAPYGLIEKIYVYLSITDAGVEVTENVA